MTSTRHIGRDILVATTVGSVAKLAGISREVLIAALAGAHHGVDAFFVALVVPTTIGSLLGTGTHAAFVPILARQTDPARAERFVNGVLSITLALGLALVAVVEAFADPVVDLFGPGLTPIAANEAVTALRIVTPLLVLLPLEGLIAAIYQVRGNIGFASVALAASPIATLVVLVGFWPTIGIAALPAAALTGGIASVAVLIANLSHAGHRLRLVFDRRSADMHQLAAQILPLVVATSILTTNTAIDRAVATTLGTGAVAALAFGTRIVYAPLDLVMNAVTAVIFPHLSRAAGGLGGGQGELLTRSLRAAAPLLLPAAGLMAATAHLAVRVLYQRGAFDVTAAQLTSSVVVGLSPLVLLIAYQGVLNRAFQASLRSRTLALLAIVNAVLNLVLDVVLAPLFGVAGIAVSTTLTIGAIVAVMGWLSRSERDFDLAAIIDSILRSAVVTAGAVLTAIVLLDVLPDDGSTTAAVINGLAVWVVGGIVVLALSAAARLSEPRSVLSLLAERINRIPFVRRRRGGDGAT